MGRDFSVSALFLEVANIFATTHEEMHSFSKSNNRFPQPANRELCYIIVCLRAVSESCVRAQLRGNTSGSKFDQIDLAVASTILQIISEKLLLLYYILVLAVYDSFFVIIHHGCTCSIWDFCSGCIYCSRVAHDFHLNVGCYVKYCCFTFVFPI